MTMQAGDTLIYDKEKYITLIHWSVSELEIEVNDIIGVETKAWETCCRRGYYATFIIKNDKLILEKLIACSSDKFKKINNKRPRKRLSNLFNKEYKFASYKDLNYELKLTGIIKVVEVSEEKAFDDFDIEHKCKVFKFKNGVLEGISNEIFKHYS